MHLYSSRLKNGERKRAVTTKNRDLGDCRSFPVQNRDYTDTIQQWRGLVRHLFKCSSWWWARFRDDSSRLLLCNRRNLHLKKHIHMLHVYVCAYAGACSSRGYLSLSLFLPLYSNSRMEPKARNTKASKLLLVSLSRAFVSLGIFFAPLILQNKSDFLLKCIFSFLGHLLW